MAVGLFLEVVPAGGKRWRLKYRFGGKEKLLSLGVYPDVLVESSWRQPEGMVSPCCFCWGIV